GPRETWPAGTGLELGVGIEKLRAAACATVNAGLVVRVVAAGERALRPALAGNREGLGVELLPPLVFGFFHASDHCSNLPGRCPPFIPVALLRFGSDARFLVFYAAFAAAVPYAA